MAGLKTQLRKANDIDQAISALCTTRGTIGRFEFLRLAPGFGVDVDKSGGPGDVKLVHRKTGVSVMMNGHTRGELNASYTLNVLRDLKRKGNCGRTAP